MKLENHLVNKIFILVKLDQRLLVTSESKSSSFKLTPNLLFLQTVFHFVCKGSSNHSPNLVELMIEKGADPNCQDKVLFLAAIHKLN